MCGCPQGYTFNTETNLCDKVIQVPAILKDNPKLPLYGCVDISNVRFGTAIYSEINFDQFPLRAVDNPTPKFIDNLGNFIEPDVNLVSGNLWISEGKQNYGRLNQAGIGLYPTEEWQGYVRCITYEVGNTYSVALSSTFAFRLFIDGELAILQENNLSVRSNDYLHVFLITLSEGIHCFLFEGLSSSGEGCAAGSFVCEIYKNITPQILSSISTQEILNTYYAGVSVNGIGNPITTLYLSGSPTDTGNMGNYFCESGFINSCVDGVFVCQSTLTAVPTPCCFNLTNCKTGVHVVTNTDLTSYLHKIIKVNEFSGCFVISPNLGDCAGHISVTFKSFFETCEDCLKVYYRLTDCTGEVSHLVTIQDLSGFVGKVVKISNYNVCWIVTIDQPSDILTSVNIINSFNTCQDCL